MASYGSDFTYDFHVTSDEAIAPVEYNYRTKAELLRNGEPWFTEGEHHGLSVFYKDASGDVFHTYSTYARGTDLLVGAYNYLDLTPKGRNETTIMDWVRTTTGTTTLRSSMRNPVAAQRRERSCAATPHEQGRNRWHQTMAPKDNIERLGGCCSRQGHR